jgi:hypothetical protein
MLVAATEIKLGFERSLKQYQCLTDIEGPGLSGFVGREIYIIETPDNL